MQKTVTKGLASIRLNTDKLEDIQKALLKNYRVQVGVLGEKAGRLKDAQGEGHKAYAKRARAYTKDRIGETGEMTNADIGLVHEKGSYSRNIPARSFLAVPLFTHQDEFTKVKKIIKASFEKTEITMFQAYVYLGVVAEQIIQHAFTSSGDGSWPALKHRKGKPLIDTAQLRRSIMSRVVTK